MRRRSSKEGLNEPPRKGHQSGAPFYASFLSGTAGSLIVAGAPVNTGKLTRLSCHRFRANEVWPALSLLAYNLADLWRRLLESQ